MMNFQLWYVQVSDPIGAGIELSNIKRNRIMHEIRMCATDEHAI